MLDANDPPLERLLRLDSEKRGQSPFRLVSIDIWRGVSISFVITSHLFFGLYKGEMTTGALSNDPLLLFFSLFSTVGQMFFIISSTSLILSMERQVQNGKKVRQIIVKEIKRGLFILAVGVAYDPVVYFHFGLVDALQCIGVCDIIIVIVYYRFLDRHQICSEMPGTEPVWDESIKQAGRMFAILGIVVASISPMMRLLFGYPIADPAIEPLIYCIPPSTFPEMIQAWLTTSFFPLFPCLAYFFFGAWLGCKLVLVVKAGDIARRQFARRLIVVGVVIMLVTVVWLIIGEELSGSLSLVPQIDMPWWVVELTFQLQPITSGPFFLYLGMNFFVVGLLSFIFEVAHSRRWILRVGRIYNSLGMGHVFNMYMRFSRYSLTIYILQYAWIPVLRIITIVTGEPTLYTIPIEDIWITVLIILAALLAFAFLTKFLDGGERNRFTFEYVLKKVAG